MARMPRRARADELANVEGRPRSGAQPEQPVDSPNQQCPCAGLQEHGVTSGVERGTHLPCVVAADDENRNRARRRIASQGTAESEAVHAGHAEVGDDDVRYPSLRFGQAANPVRGESHGYPRSAQEAAEQVPDPGLVVNHQDVGCA